MIVNTMMENQRLSLLYGKQFEEIFQVKLNQYFDLMRGFHLKDFQKDFDYEKYGNDTVELIKNLNNGSNPEW